MPESAAPGLTSASVPPPASGRGLGGGPAQRRSCSSTASSIAGFANPPPNPYSLREKNVLDRQRRPSPSPLQGRGQGRGEQRSCFSGPSPAFATLGTLSPEGERECLRWVDSRRSGNDGKCMKVEVGAIALDDTLAPDSPYRQQRSKSLWRWLLCLP